ncbi:PREDICTED: protein sevenless-like, partial [Papilio polytes]|uniref:protein sevenless-like n=1 Tax=Papilio polytes TaxID=76194 RepID=UPI0006760CF0
GGPLTAVFRWKVPSRPNGVIRQYEVQCWSQPAAAPAAAPSPPPKSSACPAALLPPLHTQIMLRDLMPNSVYFFRVRAYTDAGYGEFSEVISAPSDEINPIPKVMISSQESIKTFDLDSGDSEIVPKSTGRPVDFVVSTEENVVYWVNNLEEIFSSRINGSGHYKLTSINASATSICADWVGRAVYWSQHEVTASEAYVVYRARL